MGESATRAGIREHRVRSVYYQLHVLYAMRRRKHPDKEAHKSHNHHKAIFEPPAKEGQTKTNASSEGGRDRVDESVESLSSLTERNSFWNAHQ